MNSIRILLAASLLASVAAVASSDAIARGACTNGPTLYQGERAFTSCGGPATAVVKLGGRTLRYRGGTCRQTSTALELNMGTTIVGQTTKPLPRYFGIAIGRLFGAGRPAPKDGSYRGGILAVVDDGKRYASFDTQVRLSGGRTRGSFTAKLLEGATVSGSFLCG
jgi:hypothetical protein